MLKKVVSLFGAAVFMAVSLNMVFAESAISVKVDGQAVEFDQPPIVENGRTLIPFRAVLEEMGLYVDWDADSKTIICSDGDIMGVIPIGSKEMIIGNAEQEVAVVKGEGVSIDGMRVTLDVPAKIVNGRTLIPIRAIAEIFDAEVEWNPETKTVDINTFVEDIDVSEYTEIEQGVINVILALGNNSDNLDEDTLEKVTALLSDFQEYAMKVQDLEETQENVDKVTEELKKYLQQLKAIADANGIEINETAYETYDVYGEDYGDYEDALDTSIDYGNDASSEEYEAISELTRVFQEVTQHYDSFDEKSKEEFESMGDIKINNVMDNVNKTVESQEEKDKIIKTCNEYREKLLDLARRNGITVML